MMISRLALLTAAAAAIGGCGQLLGFGGGDSSVEITSLDHGAVYSPALTTSVYRSGDDTEADILLTDMPLARLADPTDDLADLSGNIVHIRMFLIPQAGMTPVDQTACNGTVRHAILTGGTEGAGIYVGGGFIVPHDDPGDESFSASAKNISVRLSRASATFADRIGPGLFTGVCTARLDERTAGALLERLGAIERRTQPVPRKKDGSGQ